MPKPYQQQQIRMRVRPAGPLSVALPDSVHLQVGPYLTHQRPAWRGSFLRILRIPRHGAPAGLQRCTSAAPKPIVEWALFRAGREGQSRCGMLHGSLVMGDRPS